MSDKINVAIRIRPLINRETHGGLRRSNWKVQNEECIYQIDPAGKMVGNPYSFDYVFEQDKTNEIVFEKIAVPIVDACIAGFHGTIFAYGQTSSGKTHTMTGTSTDRGLVPLSVSRIFDAMLESPDRDFCLRVSYMEIYNEKICDLLAKEQKPLTIKENYDGQLYVQNLEEITVTSKEELMTVMSFGDLSRRTGETHMNEKSSRSHSIFRLIIESQQKGDDGSAIKVSHFNLVDLAGSERVAQTGATGERLREGCHINKSLSTLCLVIYKLSIGEDFVNYRDSKLTRILQGALGGNSRTSIICTVTPASVEETHSTLKFANNAKAIKNKPIVNEVLSDAAMLKRYEKEINKLKSQLGNMDSMKLLSASEWRAMQVQIEQKDSEKKLLAERIKKLQEEVLISQFSTGSSDGFKLRSKRRETCCLGLLPKKNNLPPNGDDFNEFKRPISILPPAQSREEFVSPETAFASLPADMSFERPLARRMSFSPPRGRRGVVLFNPVVQDIDADSDLAPGQCGCGAKIEELERDLEYLREENENLQDVNERMIVEMESRKDFSLLEKNCKQLMSPTPGPLLSPAPTARHKSLIRTLLTPGAKMNLSPMTSRLERFMSPTTRNLRQQLETALVERDEALQEVEDLKNFLGVDLLDKTETNVDVLKQERDRARESLAEKHVMLSEARETVDVLKQGLLECQGKIIEVDQNERRKFEKKMERLESERDRLLSQMKEVKAALEVVTGERDVLQAAANSSGRRHLLHEEERDRLLAEVASLRHLLAEQETTTNATANLHERNETEVSALRSDVEAEVSALRSDVDETRSPGVVERMLDEKVENHAVEIASLNKIIDDLKMDASSTRAELLEEQMNRRLSETDNSRDEIEELRVILADRDMQLTSTREELDKFQETLDQVFSDLSEEQSRAQDLELQLNHSLAANREAAAATEESQRLQADLDRLREKDAAAQEELIRLQADLVRDKEMMSEVAEQLATAKLVTTTRDSEILKLKEDIAENLAVIVDHTERRNDMECMIQKVNAELIHEREQVAELKQRIQDNERFQTQETDEKVKSLQAELQALSLRHSDAVSRHESENSSLVRNRDDLLRQVDTQQREIARLEVASKSVEELQFIIAEANKQIAELSGTVHDKENMIEAGMKELTRLENICDELEAELTEEQQKTAELEQVIVDERAENSQLERQYSEAIETQNCETDRRLEEMKNEIIEHKTAYEAAMVNEKRLEAICDHIEAERALEQDKTLQLELTVAKEREKVTELERRLSEMSVTGTVESQQRIAELEEEVTRLCKCVEYGNEEENRLGKICDDLERELEEESKKTLELQRRLDSTDSADTDTKHSTENLQLKQKIADVEAAKAELEKALECYQKEEARLEKICDELEAELNAEVARREDLEQKMNTMSEKESAELKLRVEELEKSLADHKLDIHYGKEEEKRLERLCDQLDEELNQEQERTAELENQLKTLNSGVGGGGAPVVGALSKDVEILKKELATKDLCITRHLSEEKRLRTVLDKARQDLAMERKRVDSLNERLQSRLAVGVDDKIQEKMVAFENTIEKYKSSLEQKSKEVLRMKAELHRVSQLQDQQSSVQAKADSLSVRSSASGGATCTGSGVTDDIAVYTLEAKNNQLQRELNKQKTEYNNVKTRLTEYTKRLAETAHHMYKYKDRVEELESRLAELENVVPAPQQQPAKKSLFSRANVRPSHPLYELLPIDTSSVVSGTVAPPQQPQQQQQTETAAPPSPDNCKQS